MCGIFGIIGTSINKRDLDTMVKLLKHRGPDANSIFMEESIGIGHVRLSIIDVSDNAIQPILSNCKNFVLSFNGEIYNFEEIKLELKSRGHKFISSSDSEVLINGFAEWGINILDKLIGMFAFAVYDRRNKDLFLVRDRLGVKPIYYLKIQDKLFFASELKAFKNFEEINLETNMQALSEYFVHGYIKSPNSIFKNIYKINPGSYLKINTKTLKIEKIEYWAAEDFYHKKSSMNYEAAKKNLSKILVDSVLKRTISDVPWGVYLSGGADSTFTSVITSSKYENTNAFTLGFDDLIYDESINAENTATYLNLNHKMIKMTAKDFIENLSSIAKVFDEPFADTSALPTIMLSKYSSDFVKVVLSSDGGDEIFYGYKRYNITQKYFHLFSWLPNFSTRFFSSVLRKVFSYSKFRLIVKKIFAKLALRNSLDKIDKFIFLLNIRNPIRFSEILNSIFLESEINDLLLFSTTPLLYQESNPNLTLLQNLSLNDLKYYLPDNIFTKLDRATMFSSIEGREPLADHRLVEFVATLPDNYKTVNDISKRILKDIIRDIVPSELLSRKKKGFSPPIIRWLSNGFINKHILEFGDSFITDSGLSIDYINKLIVRAKNGEHELYQRLYAIYMYLLWYKEWSLND